MTATFGAWRRWRQLDRLERRATFAAALTIPLMATGVPVLGYDRVRRWAGRSRTARDEPPQAADVARLVRATRRAAHWSPYHGNCLSQSLALFRLLRRGGIDAQLRLGARTANGRLDAHAWVEWDGVALNDHPGVAASYAPLGGGPWHAPAGRPGPGG